MDLKEINNRLEKFADLLDSMPSSRLKGELSSIFTGYVQAVNRLSFYDFLDKRKDLGYYD